ncbi:MAG: hypothetical protein WD757_06865 [Actinomycetota bacterium]
MPAIWANDSSDENAWQLVSPAGFPNEAQLHDLVEKSPQLLPLAGEPQLVVLGREVRLGSGYADLLAVEPTGRLAVIEVKLAHNSEARRAIVAQALAYAAYLHHMSAVDLEDLTGSQLKNAGYENIVGAVAANYQVGNLNQMAFEQGLANSLANGRFRIVFVLDDAPPDLVKLVGYLEAMAPELLIDLITVSSYDINGSQVVVPQRVDPESHSSETQMATSGPVSTANQAVTVNGSQEFADIIQSVPQENQALLTTLLEWAVSLEKEGLAKLRTSIGLANRRTLLPIVKGYDAGLVTIWCENGTGYMTPWRTAIEKLAPGSVQELEEALAPTPLGQGNSIKEISDRLLKSLSEAYREASTPADTVIVAASNAYPEYLKHAAYICQNPRSFRDGLTHMGFYTDHAIKPEIPRIKHRRRNVDFTSENATQLAASSDSDDRRIAELIEASDGEHTDRTGKTFQVFLLSSPGEDKETVLLKQPVAHESQGAWTQGQRYARLSRLKENPLTTAALS